MGGMMQPVLTYGVDYGQACRRPGAGSAQAPPRRQR
jgi:hypothetical protein